MGPTNGHLVNGDSIQFEYGNNDYSDEGNNTNDTHSSGKKKKKKKKSKKPKAPSVNVIGEELDFDDPDFEYPDSRILKQNSNGDVIVQSLAPPKGSNPVSTTQKVPKPVTASSAASDDLLPTDPVELNNQLKEYWQSLSVEEKKDLLDLERDSVFKVMKDQQKITCNCSVCGRKRQIIEGELKKLYDTYFEGIDTHELINSDLFNLPTDKKSGIQTQHAPKQQDDAISNETAFQQTDSNQVGPSSQSATNQRNSNAKLETTRKNGIMSVAEDLLQNDGRKFLEMMEKLAESRIQRQSQFLKKSDPANSDQIEEEENHYYGNYDDVDVDHSENLEHSHNNQQQPQRQNLSISDINFGVGYHEESDATFEQEETDIDDLESEEFWSDEEEEISKDEYLLLIEESKAIMEEDIENLTGDPDQMLDLQLRKQHQQLQREKRELEQLQEEFLEDEDEDEYDEDVGDEYDEDDQDADDDGEEYDEDYDNEYEDDEDESEEFDQHHSHTHSCGHDIEHDHSHSHSTSLPEGNNLDEITDLLKTNEAQSEEEYEEYSDEAIDEEQQLEEGRAMLQLCTTKMLKQSLIESLKNKRREENINALLNELDEEADRQKLKEEKKLREKEKKREKKRLLQQQKEEERLKKEAEQERLKREKEEEQRRKVEEGRRRKQEQDKKRLEEKRRKEEEQERLKREREEKRRLKEEARKQKEEEERKAEEEAERKLLEEEQLKLQQARELFDREELIKQQQALQQKIAVEEEERNRQQETLRAQSTIQQQSPSVFQDIQAPHGLFPQFGAAQPSVNPLLDNIFQNSPFLSSPLDKSSVLQTQTPPSLSSAPPPGFGLDNQLGQFKGQPQFNSTVPQASNTFFSPRVENTFNAQTVSSPWANNQTTLSSNLYNPLFDSKVDTLPSQSRQSFSSVPANLADISNGSSAATPLNASLGLQNGFNANGSASEVDFLSSKLSTTNFDDFNGGSNILSSSRVWSSQPVSNRPDWSGISNSSTVWGGSPAPTQIPPSLAPLSTSQNTASNGIHGLPAQQPAPLPSGPNTDVNLLLGSYHKLIYDIYSIAQRAHISNGWMDIKELNASFNLVQPGQSLELSLFISLLQSPNSQYSATFANDDGGNLTHVKLTGITPTLNRGLGSTSRNGSVFQLSPLNGGISEASGFSDRLNGGFDQNLNNGLTWGSTL